MPSPALSLVAGTAPATPTFPFGDLFESKVVALLLTQSKFARSVRDALLPEHCLDQQHRIIIEHALAYLEKYRTLIEPVTLWRDFICCDRRVPAAEHVAYGQKIAERLDQASSITDGPYIQDKLLEWARNQTLLQLAAMTPALISAGRADELDRRWKKAMSLGEDTGFDEVDYYATASLRKDRRDAIASGVIKRGVPTGFPDIDKHIYAGGYERSGFTFYMAPTKRGKTMMMLQSALYGSLSFGVNALYVSLEVSDEIATDRMDAALSGINIDELARRSADVEAAVQAASLSPMRTGSLFVIRRPTNTLTPGGLEAIIDRHLGLGRKLDVVFVDYIGIMKTRSDHRYEDLGYLTKELRRIGGEYDIAMVSGYQTNRDGLGASTAGIEHMSESFAPAMDADLVLSINADDAEMKAGVRRIHWAAGRNEPQLTLKVQSDLAKGRLIDSIIGTIL